MASDPPLVLSIRPVDTFCVLAVVARSYIPLVRPVLLTIFFAWATHMPATNLRVSVDAISSASGVGAQCVITIDVQWRNGWRNDKNYDAAWIVLKSSAIGSAMQPVRLAPARHSATALGGPTGEVHASADGIGAFVLAADEHRGDVHWKVHLAARQRADCTNEVHAFGVEVVYVPAGSFFAGDSAPESTGYSAVFRSDGNGNPDGVFNVSSEDPITVGPTRGALFYHSLRPQYEGDEQGPIPAAFPKGFQAFFVMKYEVSQGEYANFLNGISAQATAFRAIHGVRGYADNRGSIRLDKNLFVAGAPARPANWISWDDGLAFADWAGLRPMTELEFTKACRGPGTPIAHEYPWGTDTISQLKRVMGDADDLVDTGDADESRLTDATRAQFGASFYWILDLAGSVWERVITFGNPRGRSFRGSHGDGILTVDGNATNGDWPQGDYDAGGYGYRGGGYYERGMKAREFNPYSPIEWRRFGSWGGGPRGIAYGFRAVRTAERPWSSLEVELRRIAKAIDGKSGIFVLHVESGASVEINGDERFAMMSSYKLPIAIHILRQVEAGVLSLDDRVTLTAVDRRPGYSPLGVTLRDRSPQTLSVREALSMVVRLSDNTVSDKLLKMSGGPRAVRQTLAALHVPDIDVSRYEIEFAADYRGICCINGAAEVPLDTFIARAESIPEKARLRAAQSFSRDPRDTATPRAFATLLARLSTGELLNFDNTRWLLHEMTEMHVRDTRIRAGIPSGTLVALRPGTSGETAGVRAAHNDAGIVTLTDSTHLVVVAFLKDSKASDAERDDAIASVARAAYKWASGEQ